MTFVADDFTAWLVGFLADVGRKRLTELFLGSEQERALRLAADVAVHRTAEEFCPGDGRQADQLAMVIDQVFATPVPSVPPEGFGTLLEAVQEGIAGQLAPLDDDSLTGTGSSSAQLLGVSAVALADTLMTQFMREILVRGAGGGPLATLASQLNHDVTHLQGQRVEGALAQLSGEVLDMMAGLRSELAATRTSSRSPAGQLLSQISDPFALEVHRPFEITAGPGGIQLPLLPPYIPREHDAWLSAAVAQAEFGRSTICMLIGGSSTGKTRACWEAVQGLRDGWRLWHPIFPERADAFLAELPTVAPRTVVWLNEAQFYLLTADTAVGERVAAGLRDLLRDPGRSPVVVLGTIWPQFWQTLITPPVPPGADRHAQARLLLTGAGITVPDSFTELALEALAAVTPSDARLAEAYKASGNGQVTQFLAGVPALLERYGTAPPPVKAVIHAAMDARRLGHGPVLSRELLGTAAVGYLTDEQWEQAGEHWLEAALAYTAAPCNGVRGPVAPVRSRPSTGFAGRAGPQGQDEEPASFRLADYLEQIGQRERADQMPPASFWDALLTRGDTAGLPGYAKHAEARGLHHYAALLRSRAVAVGHASPAEPLIKQLLVADPWNARRASRWIAAHVSLTDPAALYSLLEVFVDIGAGDAAAVLLAGNPAAHVELNRLEDAAKLIYPLSRAGAGYAALTLAERVADHVYQAERIDAGTAATILRYLGWAYIWQNLHMSGEAKVPAIYRDNSEPGEIRDGIAQIARDLMWKFIENAELTSPYEAGRLIDELKEIGVEAAAAVLVEHGLISRCGFNSDTPGFDFSELLNKLDPADASELLARAVSEIDLNRAKDLSTLLELVNHSAEKEQLTAILLARGLAAQADLTDLGGVNTILGLLHDLGAIDAVNALAGRAVEQADMANPSRVAKLLNTLTSVGADDAACALLARDPAIHADITDGGGIADLLAALQGAQADSEVAALLARDPSVNADLASARGVADLLRRLNSLGNADAVAVLLARNPAAQVELGDAYRNSPAISDLVEVLNDSGAPEASAVLVKRAADGGMSRYGDGWIGMAREMGLAGFASAPLSREPDGTAAGNWGWYDLAWDFIPVRRPGSVQLEVRDVSTQATSHASILLTTHRQDSSLTIPVDEVDAMAAASFLSGTGDEGLAHDLICEVLRACDVQLLSVHIVKSDNRSYASELTFSTGKLVNVRPADAIAIAIRVDAAIFADASVLERISPQLSPEAEEAAWSKEDAFRYPKVGSAPPEQETVPTDRRDHVSAVSGSPLRQMHLAGVSPDAAMIVLKEHQQETFLSIPVRPAESLAVFCSRDDTNAKPAQIPVIYQTFCRILEALGIQLMSVCITDSENGTLSSRLTFSDGRTTDAKGSGAIAIALLVKAAIFATAEAVNEYEMTISQEDSGGGHPA